MSTAPASQAKPIEPASPSYAWAGVVLAALTAFGSLYLSYAEGKLACPLCFYQRAFAFGVLGIMLVGLLTKINEKVSVATLALPVAFAGLGVALWHVNLERTEQLICPSGMFGISSAPKQSAIMFGILSAVLIIDAYQPGRLGCAVPHVVGAAALGVAIAFLCWNGAVNKQPDRPIPAEEYPEEGERPKTCLKVKKDA